MIQYSTSSLGLCVSFKLGSVCVCRTSHFVCERERESAPVPEIVVVSFWCSRASGRVSNGLVMINVNNYFRGTRLYDHYSYKRNKRINEKQV